MARQRVRAVVLEVYCRGFCNWGRWGPDDELGTLNFVTAEKVARAAGLVRRGKTISLALAFDEKGPQNGSFRRTNPIHQMLATGTDHVTGAQGDPDTGARFGYGYGYSDDTVSMPLQCGTQWDALSHIFRDGKMYNGYDAALVSASGARRNGIEKLADKVVGRGALLDIPRYRGAPYVDVGDAVTTDELEGCAASVGLEVGEGDFVLVRTGEVGRRLREGDWGPYCGGDAPGLSFTTAPWMYERSLAGIATDTWGVEVRPYELEGGFSPLHLVILVNMGMLVGEIFNLEPLAEDCAADGVYEFFFVAPPLPFTGAVGSPINPLALK